jgi:hypothetical protein
VSLTASIYKGDADAVKSKVFVIFGSATAASAALFMFPWLASVSVHRKKAERKELQAA